MTDFPLYPKIQSLFKRDPETNYSTFLDGQYADEAFEFLMQTNWYATEKVDGTNMRIRLNDDGTFDVGGRTERAQIHEDLLAHMFQEVGPRIPRSLTGMTFFGEGYGAGIQKGGGRYRPDKGFIVFDVLGPNGVWASRDAVRDIAAESELPTASIERWGPLGVLYANFRQDVLRGGGVHSNITGGYDAEGWVLRPETEMRNQFGGRVITKLKTVDFP